MRWVFAFVVIVNAVAFWWYSSQTESESSQQGEISSAQLNNIPSLKLLREEPRQSSGQVPDAAEQDKQELAVKQAEPERDEASVVDAAVDAKEEEGAPVARQQPLELVSEQLVEASAVGDAPAMCIELGPFPEVISARQVKTRLTSLDIPAEVEERKIEIDPIYWIYIEPVENRGKALVLLRELQNKRIDSFLISEGEFTNGISLGFFRQKSSAEEMQKKRADQGYDAKIQVKQRFKERFWLSLPAESAAKFSDSLMSNLLSEYNYLQKKENSCDRVASTPNFE